jgi:L-iditol 2-dehydrogenase
MLLQMARLAGAATVTVANRSPERLELARKLGADLTVCTSRDDLVSAVRDATGGRGVDVIFIACPAPEVQEQSLEMLGVHGRVSFFGGLPAGREHIKLNSNTIHYGQLTVTGSHGCAGRHCRRALEVQSSLGVDLRPLVTNVFALAEAAEAMATAIAGKGLRTIIRP